MEAGRFGPLAVLVFLFSEDTVVWGKNRSLPMILADLGWSRTETDRHKRPIRIFNGPWDADALFSNCTRAAIATRTALWPLFHW